MCGRKKASVVEAAVREASGTPPPPPCTYPRRARTRGRYIRRFDPGRTDRRNASTDGNARRGGRVPSPTPTHRSRHDPCGPCPRRYFHRSSVMTITMDHRISSGIAHIMPAFQHIVPCAHCVRLCIRQGNTSSLYHRAHHASQPRAHCSFVYPARERKFSVRMLFMCIRQGNASSLSVCCSCVSGKGTQVLDRMLSCSALINIIRRRERLNP